MAINKEFTVYYYTARVQTDDGPIVMADLLSSLVVSDSAPVIKIGATDYEIRDLVERKTRAVYQGVFAKIRTDDAPHIRAKDGLERDIDMEADEGLIEKNHFQFYRKYNLLVYQANGHGSRVGRLQEYFSALLDERTFFDPVLQADSMKRLLADKDHTLKAELTFSKPTNPNWYPKESFNKELFALMNSTDGASVTMTINARRPGEKTGFMNKSVISAFRELLDRDEVRKAKVFFESDHGDRHDIDLIADRLYAKIKVQMDGRYPNSSAMYQALGRAYDERKEQLDDIFGDDVNNRID